MTLICTSHASRFRGVYLDRDNIREAIEIMGLKRSVVIKWVGSWRSSGGHRLKDGRHLITVSSLEPSSEVSKTIWHELRHAEQCERLGYARYSREYGQNGRIGSRRYHENKFEVEARETEENHYELPLAYYG